MTPQEEDLINRPIYMCTEEENLIRKRALAKIQYIRERMERRKRHRSIISRRVNTMENILNKKNVNVQTKWKEYRKLAKFLATHSRFNQALEYLSLAISYKQEIYEQHDPRIMEDNLLYNDIYRKMKAHHKGLEAVKNKKQN